MTNNLVTTFEDITVGDTINNPDVGIFTVIAINADKDRVLLLNQNPNASNRYIGAFALQKKPNGNGWYWGQGHYFGGLLKAATEYVLGVDDQKTYIYLVIKTVDVERGNDTELVPFDTYEKAKTLFDEWVWKLKEENWSWAFDNDGNLDEAACMEHTDSCFEIWENDDYFGTVESVQIKIMEVK